MQQKRMQRGIGALLVCWLLALTCGAWAQGNNGTAVGSPTYAAGKFSTAVTLSNTAGAVNAAQYITVSAGSTFAFVGGVGTMECWVKTSAASGVQVCLSYANYNSASVGTAWFGTNAGVACASVSGLNGGALFPASGGTNIADGAWHHLALTLTGGTTAKFWVDGALSGTQTGGTYSVGTGPFYSVIGGLEPAVSPNPAAYQYGWTGMIDEVAISSTARYTATFTPPTAAYTNNATGLFALYHLDGGTADSYGAGTLTAVSVNDANWYWSPYNSYKNGSVSVQWPNPGAYFSCVFAGSQFNLAVDLSGNTSGALPKIKWSVDNSAWNTYQFLNGDTGKVLASGLSTGNHTLVCLMMASDAYGSRWTGASGLKITGATLDAGAALQSSAGTVVAPRAKNMIAFGDSELEGAWNTGTATPASSYYVQYEDATQSYINAVASALGTNVGNCAFGGSSWLSTFNGDVPPLPSSWQYYFGANSRLSSGKLSPIPDYVYVNLGTNDQAGNTQATVTTWLASIRGSVNTTTPIFVCVPFSQLQLSNLTAAVAAAGDAYVYLINPALSPELNANTNQIGTPSRLTSDGLHPWYFAESLYGAGITQQIQAKISGTATILRPIGGGPVHSKN